MKPHTTSKNSPELDLVGAGSSRSGIDVDRSIDDDARHIANLLGRPQARVVVTGQPGSGKTSLCQRVVAQARAHGCRVAGILSPEVRRWGQRVGYDVVDVCTGDARPFARQRGDEPVDGIPVGRFVIDPAGLAFARGVLEKAVQAANCHLIVVDEVGRLEMHGEGLMAQANAALRGPSGVLVIVRRDLLTEFLAQFPDQRFHVFDDDARRARTDNRE